MSQAHVTHIGTPFAPIADILDAHLPEPGHWRVSWDGEHAYVSHDDNDGTFTISSGTAWGPYWKEAGGCPEVVQDAFWRVRVPLTDRLIRKMCGAS